MRLLSAIFVLSSILSGSNNDDSNPLEILHEIHPLRPRSGSAGTSVSGLSCLSWRLAVETRNIIDWKTVPQSCEKYVGNYMIGKQYRKDCKVVADEALAYAKSLNVSDKSVWVFDIDETTLSNLPYYANHGFGTEKYNSTSFNEWVFEGTAPALPESRNLYNQLISLGIKIVFITGRTEDQLEITAANLKNAGYTKWEKLVLKGTGNSGKTAVEYKSAQRQKVEAEGNIIVGNMGDQWTDLLGTNVGKRTFKVPDPMYYIS